MTPIYCGFHPPPQRKCGYSASNSATTASFHDPSNSLVTNHPSIRRFIASDADSVVSDATNKQDMPPRKGQALC
jgi:hypothetical protein